MKCYGKRFLSVLFIIATICSFLCISASAATESSAYIDSYRATVVPESRGYLTVTGEVDAVSPMTKLGVSLIYLYESTDGSLFDRVATYTPVAHPHLMGSGLSYDRDFITYRGTPGRYYYASVYFYAEDETGSDEKNYITAVRQAVATAPDSDYD